MPFSLIKRPELTPLLGQQWPRRFAKTWPIIARPLAITSFCSSGHHLACSVCRSSRDADGRHQVEHVHCQRPAPSLCACACGSRAAPMRTASSPFGLFERNWNPKPAGFRIPLKVAGGFPNFQVYHSAYEVVRKSRRPIIFVRHVSL